MKRHLYRLVAAFAAVFAAASCNVSSMDPVQPSRLTLVLDSRSMQTRAGEATSFEGVIDHFDFFFFEDAEGTAPIAGIHGRVSGNTITLNTGVGQDYEVLRYRTSYVYILANYPEELSHTTTDYTLEELLRLPLNYPIARIETDPVTEAEEFSFCDYLVMDSYDSQKDTYTTELTPKAYEEARSETIGLSRIAAKLSLTITVPESATGDGGEVWTPAINSLQAYFVNALNNKPSVDATPVKRNAITDETGYEYMTYPDDYPLVRREGTRIFDLDPVYTYPQEWEMGENGEPYFKIAMPWIGSIHGSDNFYYKVSLPSDCKLDRNCWYKVSVTLSVIDTEAEYVEINPEFYVSPWSDGPDGGGNLSSAVFFNVPKKVFEIYNEEEVNIPFSSSSAVTAYFAEFSYTHYKVGAGETHTFNYTAEDNVSSITLSTTPEGSAITPAIAKDNNIYSITVEGKRVKFEHALKDIYTVRNVKLVIKNEDGREEEVIIKQHPAIEVKSRPAGTVFVNGHFARALESVHVNGDPTKKMGKPFTLHYNPGQGETRYHSDDIDFTGTSYGGANTYWYYPGNSYTGTESDSPLIMRNVDYGRYGYIEGDTKRDQALFMVEVIVSAFNDNNNKYVIKEDGVLKDSTYYRLGDPRVDAGSRFNVLKTVPSKRNNRTGGGYLYQSSTLRNSDNSTTEGYAIYKAWDQPEKIKIASTNKLDANFIAPHFIVSSFFNAQPGSLTHENCLKRAATYQEAGYPAGRWRLPTEAEIMFMVQQQQRGVLPVVWASGSHYWCADGRYVTVGSSGDVVTFTTPSAGAIYVNRFVYDLWYWGDEPMSDSETYWANMHLVTPNTNSGN